MTTSAILAYVSPEPERPGHASYTHVHEIIDGLTALGWQVDLYCPRYGEREVIGPLRRLLNIGGTMWRAIVGPRACLYYMRWHFAAFPVAAMARLRGIPTVIEVNGPVEDLFIAWPLTRRIPWLFNWLMHQQLRWARGAVAVTDGLRAMTQDLVSASCPVITVPNGANIDQFTPQAAGSDNPYVRDLPARYMIFFGTMARWQGIRTIMAAFEQPAWPKDVHLVFAGAGVESKAVEDFVARHETAHMLGRVPYEDLPAVVARAMGAFVSTENLQGRGDTGMAPLKLFESLACGVPVVASNLPYQSELVERNHCGYIFQETMADDLARAVSELVADPDVAAKMGRNGREFAEREGSWQARARQTDDLLKRIQESGT